MLAAAGVAVALHETGGGGRTAPPTSAPPTTAPPPPTTTAPPATTTAPALPPSRPATSAIWQQAGVFVADTRSFDPRRLVAGLTANHFSWVAFEVHDGLSTIPINPEFLRLTREAGLVTGAWGAVRTDPEEEASLAIRLVRDGGYAFYVADAEDAYKADAPGGVWGRSAAFVTAFRSLAPDLAAALTTYGAAPAPYVLPIDFAAWRDGRFSFLPQAYYNVSPVDRPDRTVEHALRAGWERSSVHPVIGVYGGYRASRYVPLLRAAGTRGFSVFVADQMQDSDYAALGTAIEDGLAAPP